MGILFEVLRINQNVDGYNNFQEYMSWPSHPIVYDGCESCHHWHVTCSRNGTQKSATSSFQSRWHLHNEKGQKGNTCPTYTTRANICSTNNACVLIVNRHIAHVYCWKLDRYLAWSILSVSRKEHSFKGMVPNEKGVVVFKQLLRYWFELAILVNMQGLIIVSSL